MDTGAFIYKDSQDKDICILMFKHLTEEILINLFPDSVPGDGNYLIAMLKAGVDYLGRTEYEGISKLMKDEIMIDVFSSTEDINKIIPEITEEDHHKYKEFVKMQYNTLAAHSRTASAQ
tara:strand:- start:3357 stop:3713 length:357 start_codon:yes stop_codon:yes gene_type:complete